MGILRPLHCRITKHPLLCPAISPSASLSPSSFSARLSMDVLDNQRGCSVGSASLLLWPPAAHSVHVKHCYKRTSIRHLLRLLRARCGAIAFSATEPGKGYDRKPSQWHSPFTSSDSSPEHGRCTSCTPLIPYYAAQFINCCAAAPRHLVSSDCQSCSQVTNVFFLFDLFQGRLSQRQSAPR